MTHEDYLRAAYRYAAMSRDRSTQNGAVLVSGCGDIIGTGWNDIPDGVADTQERRERPLKYQFTEHAERAAIFDAARAGRPTDGSTLYAPWLACADCGRAIVCAGVRWVVRHRIPQHASRADWAASCAASDRMFAEAGVEVIEVDGRLGVSFRFDGVVIEA